MRKSYWLAALAAAALLAGNVTATAKDRAAKARRAKTGDAAAAQANVDRRENRQAARIDRGVEKGSLTADESAALDTQQKSIADMEAKFEGDGKLTRAESRQLTKALNTASVNIWADKRNTAGAQQPVYRLGKNVTLNPDTAAKLADPNLARQDAKAFAHDFGRTLHLKRALANDDLTPDQRTKLQGEYNDLLNKYFVVQNPTPAATTPATPPAAQ